jgi:hypothetical protein
VDGVVPTAAFGTTTMMLDDPDESTMTLDDPDESTMTSDDPEHDKIQSAFEALNQRLTHADLAVRKDALLLKAVLTHAPSMEGQCNVAQDIVDCEDKIASLSSMAQYYLHSLLFPSK